MDSEVALTRQARAWLSDSVLGVRSDSYARYLTERGYSLSSVRNYLSCIAHFAHWLKKRRATLRQIDEALVQRFLDDHLQRCSCPAPARRCRHQVRAALKHLLVVLRLSAEIPTRPDTTPESIREDLRRFDAHLDRVCGLAAATRSQRARIVRTFLMEQFGVAQIDITRVKPKNVCRFVVNHVKGCKPSTGKILGVALRSYFRFRGMHGDCVQALMAAIPQIAEWRLAALPDVLSEDELERFLKAFDRQTPTGRRDYAMARCLVDLGLRACEVARLQLDDINWRLGTLRLTATKARREDVLPLPQQTGRAIANYLTDGRPVSISRVLFLRHVAPLNEPISSSVVRFAVRRAYSQCGWERRWTGTHVLRHSVASRLLRSGTPMKEIADILRHRCLDSTAIYAKVDTNKLAGVAMPWPGSAP
jgi:site-specific recombinase XerD